MEFVYFNSREELLRIEITKIVYFESNGNYTNVVTTNKLRSCVSMNLGNMERALADQLADQAAMFVRIGKRFIINQHFIYKIDIAKQQLVLSDFDHFAFQIPVSKEALRKLKGLMTTSRKTKSSIWK